MGSRFFLKLKLDKALKSIQQQKDYLIKNVNIAGQHYNLKLKRTQEHKTPRLLHPSPQSDGQAGCQIRMARCGN
jgi:hypothetical protein